MLISKYVATATSLLLALSLVSMNVSAQLVVIEDSTVLATPVLSLSNVECATQLVVRSSEGFKFGDRVLIHQVKGMTLSTNLADSGSPSEIGPAGNFELASIANLQGTTITLDYKLQRAYDATQKVQLVKVITSQSIDIRGQVAAKPWNGDCGGVIVIEATDSLILNGTITVAGGGFRGGKVSNQFQSCGRSEELDAKTPSVYYGQKGEGAAIISIDRESGIGRAANGGGGGGNHNAGGGGGGNGNAGGCGGATYTVCGVIRNGGRGGALCPQQADAPRLYFGGGGGGGHQNENRGTEGGDGGGCVLIITPVMKSSSAALIDANGSSGSQAYQDGAGGGGAGGSVFLAVETFVLYPTIRLKGGDGGSMSSVTGNHGPGGGGSGGGLLLETPDYLGTTDADVLGGMHGVHTDGSRDPWYASPGKVGSTTFNCLMPRSGSTGSGQPKNLMLECTTHGSAHMENDTLRLTDDDTYSAGAAWAKQPINFSSPFTLELSFRMTNGTDRNQKDGGPAGADGIAVIFSGAPTSRVGKNGAGIGYDGLTNCVAVEFDAYLNGQNADPGGSHLAVQSSPTKISALHQPPYLRGITTQIPTLRGDGTVYYIRIESTGSALRVFLSETANFTSPNLVVENFTFPNAITLDANATGFLGLTSATGFSVQNHEILTWSLGSCSELVNSVAEVATSNTMLSIRPNPAGEYVVVGPWNSSQSATLEVIDMTGRVCVRVQVEATEEMMIPLTLYQSGVYVVRVVDSNTVRQALLQVIK